MKGLKFFLFLQFLIFLALTVLSIVFPEYLAKTQMGPVDTLEARYNGSLYLMLFTVSLYAFRSPKKNVAVIHALITGDVVAALVGLYGALTGAADWGHSVISIAVGLVLAAGLAIYYPRGEKPV